MKVLNDAAPPPARQVIPPTIDGDRPPDPAPGIGPFRPHGSSPDGFRRPDEQPAIAREDS
jgi:hypothetical protein